MKKSSDKLLFNKNSVKDKINYLIGITFKNHRFKRSTFSIAFAIWINLLLLSHNVKVIDLMTIHMMMSDIFLFNKNPVKREINPLIDI